MSLKYMNLPTVNDDITFESSSFMLKSAHRNSKATALDLNQNGAYGNKNITYDTIKSGPWFIDNQKTGMDAVITGIYKKDEDAIRRGLKILKWGFDQQKQDGSYTSNDTYHAVSYFLASASRAVLHLKKSEYNSRFEDEIDYLTSRIEKSINWLVQNKIEKPGLNIDLSYIHRYYMNSTAVGFSGILLNRNDLILHSQHFIKIALAKQNQDGSNPEKGGTDTSYHALGLYFAAQYFTAVADAALKEKLVQMGEKGSNWLKSKVLPNGDIDSSENTRTGTTGEKRYGTETKSVTYFMIYKSLAYWGYILNRSDLTETAENVFEYSKTLKK